MMTKPGTVSRRSLLASAAALGMPLPALAARSARPRANLFIGTGGDGHTYPGATLPSGMVQLSPDTDVELRQTLWQFVARLNKQGHTVLLTTHYLEEAEQLCRNIGIIDHGTIVENTSMRQLLGKLHVETFVLDLKQDLAAAPLLHGYPCRLLTPHTLEVQVEKDIGITALFGQLALQNIEVQSLRNKTNRLEELFVSLVEKNLSKVAV